MARPGQAPPAAQRRPGRHARPHTRRSRGWLQVLGVLVVALLVTAVTIVLVRDLVLRTGAPPPPAVAPATRPAAAEPATTTSAPAEPGEPRGAGAWAGTWRVRQGDGTFVGYRVSARFAGVQRPAEAVGRTPKVLGGVVLTGTTVVSAEVRADLRELSSGDRRGDDLAGRALAVGTHPVARFELRGPVELGRRPAPGAVVAVRAPGTLTLHGVGRPVVFRLEGRWVDDSLEIVGRADIRLSRWGVRQPRVAGLVDLDDSALIEVCLRLGRG
jgi:polyisoprenoid-binding protein YceI